jgi:phi13 family phage major tail protein
MSSTTKNKIKYGLSDVYWAKINADGTYVTPVAIEGAVSLSLKPAGSELTAYGDNIAQVDFSINQGYSGSIAFNLIPDDFKTDILGETVDANGVVTESSDAKASEFALLFQFLGDVNNRRHVLYRCKASRPNVESETMKDKADAKEESLDLTVRPIANGSLKHKVKSYVDDLPETASVYANWFDKVYDGTGVLGALTVSSAAGSTTGKTALTVTPTLTSGNSYMYKTAATVTLPAYNDVCNTTASYTAWDGTSDITATTGNEIAVVEVDSSFKAIKAGKATVASK